MTDWSRHVLGQSRLIAALVTVFALAGIAAYMQMNLPYGTCSSAN